jgi:nucleotide-binding universal stress UspA family protein
MDMEAEMRGLRHMAEEVLGRTDPRVRARVVVHETVVDGIVEEARSGGYELLVIGASNEWAVKSLLVGAVPDAVADRAPCSVLMVRRCEPTGLSTVRRVVRSVKGW